MNANTNSLTTPLNKNKDNHMKSVDTAARDAFVRSIHETNYAGIEAVQNIYHAIPLSAHREAFLRGKRGDRDGQRAALFMEAAQLKNATARVLSFFVAVARLGYNGTICTEDVIAAQVVDATGGLCAPRTFRRALADLCRSGWLHKSPMATGTKILTPSGWKTNQVNKITIPWCTRLLGIRKTKPIKSINMDLSPENVECPPDIVDSNPRPKLPPMGERRENPPSERGGSSLSIVNVKDNPVVRNDESELAVSQPPASSTPPTSEPLKHQTSGEARKARKPAKKACPPFGRIARSKIPRTWQNGRRLLLHDLELAGAGAGGGVELRIATLQTDLTYPPLFPVALPWEKYVSSWIDRDWKDRQRTVKREIMPQLAAWCLPLVPPDKDALRPGASPEAAEKAREQLRQFERVSKIMKSLPEMLITKDTPRFVAEKMQECAWHLRQLPMLIFTGRMGLEDISRGQRQAFFEVAKLLNLAD